MKWFYKTEVAIGEREVVKQGLTETEVQALVTIETSDEAIHDWIMSLLKQVDEGVR